MACFSSRSTMPEFVTHTGRLCMLESQEECPRRFMSPVQTTTERAGGIIGALCRFGRQKYFHGSIIHLDSYRTLAAVKELDMRWDHVASKDRHTRGGKNHTRKGEIQLESFLRKKEWRSIANIVRCSNFKGYEKCVDALDHASIEPHYEG